MSELLPCPFCGGEAEMLTAESMNGGYLFGIMCNDCRSRGDVYDTEAEAVEAWNTRAERTCHDVKPNLSYFLCDSCDMGGGTELWIKDGFYRDVKPSYCPNCGAKVVGE